MRSWDELESRLVRGGAGRGYARRLRDELADHRHALVDEHGTLGATPADSELAADRELGDLDSLVTTALEYRGAPSLARTRPALVFLVAPLATALAALALTSALACGVAWVAIELFGMAEDGAAFLAFAKASYATIAFLVLPGIAFLFCAEAWLNRASMRWAFATCLALAALGGLLLLGFHVASPTAPGGEIVVGLGWEARALRFALPLLTFISFATLIRNECVAEKVRNLRRFAV